MTKILPLIVGGLILIGTAGCGTASDTANAPGQEEARNGAQTPVEQDEAPGAEDTEQDTEVPAEEEERVMIPEQKELELFVEGETEKRMAQLQVSKMGYSLFILEDFQLESEEPGKDVLVSTFDSSFFVRIEPVGKDADIHSITSSIKEYAQGEIHEDVPVMLDEVSYSILEEVMDGEVKTTVYHLGKEYNGTMFKLTVFMPLKEAAEGIGPSFWAMLDTIMSE